jgi:hypothetical protein
VPATHIAPPAAIENGTLVKDATAPDRAVPSVGPVEYDSCSMPAIRPRMWSGIVWFQSVWRKMTDDMSDAPAAASAMRAHLLNTGRLLLAQERAPGGGLAWAWGGEDGDGGRGEAPGAPADGR